MSATPMLRPAVLPLCITRRTWAHGCWMLTMPCSQRLGKAAQPACHHQTCLAGIRVKYSPSSPAPRPQSPLTKPTGQTLPLGQKQSYTFDRLGQEYNFPITLLAVALFLQECSHYLLRGWARRETLDKLNKIPDQDVSKLSGHEKGGQRGQTDTVPDQRRQGGCTPATGISGGILEQEVRGLENRWNQEI